MAHPIRGLHHVTATVDEAQADLDFYAGLLGQRLVKKTVNFDNRRVYHFYYGSESGAPGTIWTTFPYRGMGVRVGVHGAGQITVTSFSVPASSLDFWRERLHGHAVPFVEELAATGEEALRMHDPSGLAVRLVGCVDDPRPGWATPGIDATRAYRGLHGVTLAVREPAKTLAVVEEVFGGEVLGTAGDTTRVGVGGEGAGHLLEIRRAGPGEPDAANGLGTVHHVAFAVASDDAQQAIREQVIARGLHPTEVLDRQYFRSIYFREPCGVLFEVATMAPGFTFDESLEDLGRGLKLPPWEEARRGEIEAGLPPVHHG